jgi:hypothetical protein
VYCWVLLHEHFSFHASPTPSLWIPHKCLGVAVCILIRGWKPGGWSIPWPATALIIQAVSAYRADKVNSREELIYPICSVHLIWVQSPVVDCLVASIYLFLKIFFTLINILLMFL